MNEEPTADQRNPAWHRLHDVATRIATTPGAESPVAEYGEESLPPISQIVADLTSIAYYYQQAEENEKSAPRLKQYHLWCNEILRHAAALGRLLVNIDTHLARKLIEGHCKTCNETKDEIAARFSIGDLFPELYEDSIEKYQQPGLAERLIGLIDTVREAKLLIPKDVGGSITLAKIHNGGGARFKLVA